MPDPLVSVSGPDTKRNALSDASSKRKAEQADRDARVLKALEESQREGEPLTLDALARRFGISDKSNVKKVLRRAREARAAQAPATAAA